MTHCYLSLNRNFLISVKVSWRKKRTKGSPDKTTCCWLPPFANMTYEVRRTTREKSRTTCATWFMHPRARQAGIENSVQIQAGRARWWWEFMRTWPSRNYDLACYLEEEPTALRIYIILYCYNNMRSLCIDNKDLIMSNFVKQNDVEKLNNCLIYSELM